MKGVEGFDKNLAWEAVYKDATTPPNDDETTELVCASIFPTDLLTCLRDRYADREEVYSFSSR